jgi:hypothetical protein
MARDFTLAQYQDYAYALRKAYETILRFDEFMVLESPPERCCLIRHDIDRRPQNALAMARLEHQLGLTATYYFRTKRHTFKPDILRSIQDLGHEVGYHYECLSDANGNVDEALEDFERNLNRLRQHVSISTISMHGRPLKAFDNRDLWRDPTRHAMLSKQFGLLGEVYLDIDYHNIAYISDTGRNWTSTKSNRRDHVGSDIHASFDSSNELLAYLQGQPHPHLVFQIHPERWDHSILSWTTQYLKDSAINMAKRLIVRS